MTNDAPATVQAETPNTGTGSLDDKDKDKDKNKNKAGPTTSSTVPVTTPAFLDDDKQCLAEDLGRDDGKHDSTSTGPSLHAPISSSLLPDVSPLLETTELVGEPREKPESSASALEHCPTLPIENGPAATISNGGGNGIDGPQSPQSPESPELGLGVVEEEQPDEIVRPSGLQLGLLTVGLCMVTFTIALDNTIIATAIPKITSYFNSLNDVGWYGSSYLLTNTALQPSFGRIYTYFNVKNNYLSALVLFEIGSILCATAQSSVMLIVGRAVAGAGSSALFSGGMTIIGFTVPLVRRPIYIAALSSMFGISSVVGPLLGGALTDKASWRWCFWINLPFGAIAFTMVALFFKPPRRKISNLSTKQKILNIDLLGALFLICAIVCLLLALQWGGDFYPWKDSKVWGCLLGFALIIAVFILQQFRRGERGTIPPRIFGQRTVLFACLYSTFISMGVYTHIYYLPFYFQAVKGTSAEGSGLRTISYLVSIIIAAVIVGTAISIIGVYKPFMICGGAVFTVGAGMIYLLKVNSPPPHWIGYQILSGFGAGMGLQIPFIAVQVVLQPKDMPTGNALAIFFNSLGGAISISVAQNIFSNGLEKYIPIYAPSVSPATVISAGATHLRAVVSPAVLPGVLQAYDVALQDAFVIPIAVGGIAMILACFVEWKSVKWTNVIGAVG